MSVSAGEAKTMSGDDEHMSELKQLASQIRPQRVQRSVMKLLLGLKAQTGLGSLNYRINIVRMLLQEADYISDQTLRDRFKRAVRRHWGVLGQQLNNPITLTQNFIAVVKRIYSNTGEVTDDMFYNNESFYWIFRDRAGAKVVHDNGLGTEKDYYRDKIFRDARYFVKRATKSLQKMDLKDVVQTLDFLIKDFAFYTNPYSEVYEKPQGVLKMVLFQARELRPKLLDAIVEYNAGKKETQDKLRLPKHIRGRIKDFIGSKLRF